MSVISIFRKKWVLVLLSVLIVYKSIFNSFTGQALLSFVSKKSTGSIEGNVKRFSLLFGIRIQDLHVKSGEDFSKETILKAKELELGYGIPYLIWGVVDIGKIRLDSLELHLKEKKGTWNVAALFPSKSSEKKEEKTDSKPFTGIKWYLPIRAVADLEISNFSFEMVSEKNSRVARVSPVDMKLFLKTYRMTGFSLNREMFQSIKELVLDLNPKGPTQIFLDDQNFKIDSGLFLQLLVQQKSNGIVESKANIGSTAFPISRKKGSNSTLSFLLKYLLEWKELEDSLVLSNFQFQAFGRDLLKMVGGVKQVSSSDRSGNFEVTDSNIALGELYANLSPLFAMPRLAGTLNLTGTKIILEKERTIPKLQLRGNDVQFQNHIINSLVLLLDSQWNFGTTRSESARNPIPSLESLQLQTLDLTYNQLGKLSGNGWYQIGKGLEVILSLNDLGLAPLVKKLKGIIALDAKLSGGDFANLNLGLQGRLRNFQYYLSSSWSGTGVANLGTNANLEFSGPFELSKVTVSSLDLTHGRNVSSSGLELSLKSKISNLHKESKKIELENIQLLILWKNLFPIFPLELKEDLGGLDAYLSGKTNLKGSTLLSLGNLLEVDSNLFLDQEGLGLKDLQIQSKISNSPKELNLKEINISGFSNVLKGKINGTLPKDSRDKKIFVNLNLDSPNVLKPLTRGMEFLGNFNLGLQILGPEISGNLISKNSKFQYTNLKCPGKECVAFSVNGINGNIPIQHSLNFMATESLVEGDKIPFIETYGNAKQPNFTIQTILGNHPTVEANVFTYVKPRGTAPNGLSMFLEYKNNHLLLDQLNILTLDGGIYGRKILFNVGEGKPEKMEYTGNLQIKDIDLKQLLPEKSQAKIDDGKIKADISFKGKNLKDPIGNLGLYLSIFQIGKDFGKSVLNVISPRGIFTDALSTAYAIDTIDIELNKGLVYADVNFKRSVLTYLISLEDNKISQERMPLANFLQRAGSEVKTYR